MAIFKLDIHRVLKIFEVVGIYSCTWPIGPKTRGLHLFLRNIHWFFNVLNMLGVIIPLSLCVYMNKDAVTMMKALTEWNACMETLLDLIICRLLNDRLLKLLNKIKKFAKTAKSHEIVVLQKYIDRYSTFYLIGTVNIGLTCTGYIISAIILIDIDFPLEAWYPFSTNDLSIKYSLFLMHVICVYEVLACIFVDLTVAMFLWYCSARSEMLILELQKVTEVYVLKNCIKKHQEIIEFMRETERAVGILVLKFNCTMLIGPLCGALLLLQNQPFSVIFTFLTTVVAGFVRMFFIFWPADDLREISKQISWWVYNTPWIGQSRNTGMDVCLVTLKSQEPLVLRLPFIPSPSYEYYLTYLKAISSYFMTMRAMIRN